jgi:hypothetical protein
MPMIEVALSRTARLLGVGVSVCVAAALCLISPGITHYKDGSLIVFGLALLSGLASLISP